MDLHTDICTYVCTYVRIYVHTKIKSHLQASPSWVRQISCYDEIDNKDKLFSSSIFFLHNGESVVGSQVNWKSSGGAQEQCSEKSHSPIGSRKVRGDSLKKVRRKITLKFVFCLLNKKNILFFIGRLQAEMSSNSCKSLNHRYPLTFLSLDTSFYIKTVILKVLIQFLIPRLKI